MRNVLFNILTIMFLVLLLYSCGNKNTGNSVVVSADSAKFFPVEYYFLQQVKTADSNATHMYKLSVINGVKDSVVLSRPEFMELSKSFTGISISDSANKKKYSENSFLDLATNSFTFTYSVTDATLPVQNISILADTANLQVKRVFINKTFRTSDSTVYEKLGWKSNTGFFINRIISKPGKPDRTELITVAWNIQ